MYIEVECHAKLPAGIQTFRTNKNNCSIKESVGKLYPEYYLIKINRFNDIARDTLDEWIYFLKNEEIKESFTAKGLKEGQEKLSVMKLPEEERKAYEHYKDDLHYQASMFESSLFRKKKFPASPCSFCLVE